MTTTNYCRGASRDAVPVGTRLSPRPPDRTRRADFPHRAPTLGLTLKEPHVGPGMDDAGSREREAFEEAGPLSLSPPSSLTPPLERAVPDPGHFPMEGPQSTVVAGHTVVIDMTDHDAAQPGMLIRYGQVPSPTAGFLDAGEARPQLLSRGLALELEGAFAARAGDVHEAEERERLGLGQPLLFAFLPGESSELEDPCLVRVQLQGELRHALGQGLTHRSRVLFELESHHGVEERPDVCVEHPVDPPEQRRVQRIESVVGRPFRPESVREADGRDGRVSLWPESGGGGPIRLARWGRGDGGTRLRWASTARGRSARYPTAVAPSLAWRPTIGRAFHEAATLRKMYSRGATRS